MTQEFFFLGRGYLDDQRDDRNVIVVNVNRIYFRVQTHLNIPINL